MSTPPPAAGAPRPQYTRTTSSSSLSGHSFAGPAAAARSGGWDAIRKRVLPPHRAWAVPNPHDASDQHYPRYHPPSGRSTPTGEPRSGTPTSGVARLVGVGRRRKPLPEPSIQQRFFIELAQVEALFRTHAERSTSSGAVPTASASSRKRAAAGSVLSSVTSNEDSVDLVAALKNLERLVDRYRAAGALTDQTAVLALLLRPFSGDVGAQASAGRLALEIFNSICIAYPPGDDDELERWRWLLKAMEVENVELRTRIARAIVSSIRTEVNPHLWTTPTAPVVIQSLISALVRLLHVLSHSTPHSSHRPTEATEHFTAISALLERVASGDVFTPDKQQCALTLSFPLLTFSAFAPEKLSRIIAIDSLLLVAVGSEPTLRQWLMQESHALLARNWVPDAGGLMNGRIAALVARAAHTLVAAPSAPKAAATVPSDIFAVSDHNPHLDRLKAALDHFLRQHYPLAAISTLSPTVRGRIVHARLAFFASLSATDYQQREWPPPIHGSARPEVTETKRWVTEAWKAEKAPVVEAVRQAVRELDWDAVAGVLGTMTLGMEDKMNETIAGATFSTLFERINAEPTAATASAPLLTLLRLLAARHPTLFFKPIFTLVSATTTRVVRTALRTVLTLSTLLGPAQYLLRDAEMMVVALLAELGVVGAARTDGGVGDPGDGFESAPVGRLALLVELTIAVQKIRNSDSSTRAEKETVALFADAFESRFSLFLQTREQSSLLTFSQRILITTLLFELRMLSKPQRRPVWLQRVLVWASSSTLGSFATLEPKRQKLAVSAAQDTPPAKNSPSAAVTEATMVEPETSFNAVGLLYEDAVKEANRTSRISVPVPGIQSSPLIAQAAKATSARLDARLDFLNALDPSPLSSTLALLVAVYGQLADEDLVALCPVTWAALDDRQPKTFLPACFLFLLCGEKLPWIVEKAVAADIARPSRIARQSVVLRLSSLFSARFDILTQPSADRSRRKPFKAGRAAITFVPIEVGSASYVAPEIPEEARLRLGSNLPPEARRALVDLGWDDRTEEQTLTERQRRPLSLLPWSDVTADTVYDGAPSSPGRAGSPGGSGGLLRRSSSAGNSVLGAGVKRKAIVTNLMATLLLGLTDLLRDPDVGVAVTARNALLMFLRDDPVAVLQPILTDLSGDIKRQRSAVHLIRQLSNIQAQLPCGAAHHLFNHLGGLLKTFAREAKVVEPLVVTSFVLPAAAALVPTISDFSMRDLRKNKIEPVFLSSGPFWETGPAHFPRQRPSTDPTPFRRLAVDSTTFHLAMVRIAQNSTQASYLRKVPREAHAVRKLMGQLSLPFADDLPAVLEPGAFIPKDRRVADAPVKIPREVQDLRSLSALVARSWLLSCIQVLHGLSRHFNVHAELAVLFDGVNRILLTHGDDTNIVGLALRLSMLASTRFRRLFSSSNGFSLFIPALFKVFVDARHNLPIASSIQYAWQRFFRSHEESFVFASLGALTPVFLARGVDDATRAVMAADLFRLLGALQGGIIDTADIAGIRGANEREEREALIEQANDRPDIFLAKITGSEGSSAARLGTAYGDAKPFTIEHSIKLFLTVLAFDPTSTRAGEFLHLFRLLVPSLFADSPKAQGLLREGIEALATVYSKAGRGNKGAALRKPEPTAARVSSERADKRASVDSQLDSTEGAKTDAATWLSMRRSFLLLVEAYHSSGGELGPAAMRKTLDVVRLTLKDSSSLSTKTSSAFIGNYTRSVLGPLSAPTNAQVLVYLNEIAPFVRLYLRNIDFSSTFEALARLPLDPTLKDDPKIASLVVTKILGPALDACSAFAGQDRLLPSHRAIVRLTAAWLTHPLGDTFAELERQKASTPFLATFLFPVAVRFGKRPSTLDDASPATRIRTQKAWLWIVGYTTSACESNHPVRDSLSDSRSPAAKTAFALQILKVAIVAGEEHLTNASGVWIKLASFLRTLLQHGGSSFLEIGGPSRSGSRNGSLGPSAPGAPNWAPPALAQQELRTRLTVTDYSMWSLFELLSLFPSPILLHLRLAVREKLVNSRFAAPNFRIQRKGSLGTSPERRRSSVFARPLLSNGATERRPSQGADALAVQGSPVLNVPRPGRRRSSSITSSELPFRPTLELFARDGDVATGAYPQIRHLGPVQRDGPGFEFVEQDGAKDGWAPRTRINSAALKAKTVDRVHTVQVIFGEAPIEHPLLLEQKEEANLSAWTKAVALRNIVGETALLVEEFADALSREDHGSDR